MPSTLAELVDIETLANHLGDSVRHVRRLVAEKRFPYLKVGHLVRFDTQEIAQWLNDARHPHRPVPGAAQRGGSLPASRRF